MTLNLDRVANVIEAAVDRLKLDLHGLSVLTEAGSHYFAVTPVIAALAGARRVTAVTRSTGYGSFDEIAELVRDLSGRLGVDGRIEVVTRGDIQRPAEFDIVTNLAHLRPLDRDFLAQFDPTRLVIPYMCEKWEFRPGDLDLDYCREMKIPVAGTNEAHPDVDVFATCGVIAAKLLMERDFELRGGRYAVLSPDAFGDVIGDFLTACGAHVQRFERLTSAELPALTHVDALVIADYTSGGEIIGNASLHPAELAKHPGLELILIAGLVDPVACAAAGLPLHPPMQPAPLRMSRTLAYAGPRPVIDLHAAGLKVGELLKKGKESTLLQMFDSPPGAGAPTKSSGVS